MIRDWLAWRLELGILAARFLTVVGIGAVLLFVARWLFRAGGPFNR